MKVNGPKIKEIREGQRISKEEFALKAKVSRQAVESWENGNVETFKTLNKIARLLGVPAELLVKGKEE